MPSFPAVIPVEEEIGLALRRFTDYVTPRLRPPTPPPVPVNPLPAPAAVPGFDPAAFAPPPPAVPPPAPAPPPVRAGGFSPGPDPASEAARFAAYAAPLLEGDRPPSEFEPPTAFPPAPAPEEGAGAGAAHGGARPPPFGGPIPVPALPQPQQTPFSGGTAGSAPPNPMGGWAPVPTPFTQTGEETPDPLAEADRFRRYVEEQTGTAVGTLARADEAARGALRSVPGVAPAADPFRARMEEVPELQRLAARRVKGEALTPEEEQRAADYELDMALLGLPIAPAAEGAAVRAKLARQAVAGSLGGRAVGAAEEAVGRVAEPVVGAARRFLADEAGELRLGGGTPEQPGDLLGPVRRFFHGTGAAFDRPEAARFDPEGLYGPGYYLTSDPRVAGGIVDESGRVRTGGYAQKEWSDAPPTAHVTWDQTADAIRSVIAQGGPGQRLSAPVKEWLGMVAERAERRDTPYTSPSYLWDLVRQNVSPRAWRYLSDAIEVRVDARRAAPQVRAVSVPEGLHLLDAERWIGQAAETRIADELERRSGPQVADLFTNALGPGTGDDAHKALLRVFDGDRGEANRFLGEIGYDGIAYSGGKRIPLTDEAGRAIEHDAVVVFPEALPKIRNALSGTPGGIASPDLGAALRGAAAGVQPANLAGALAGGVAGYEASPESDTPGQTLGRVVGGALAGGATVRAARGAVRGGLPGALRGLELDVPGVRRALGVAEGAGRGAAEEAAPPTSRLTRVAGEALERARGTPEEAARLRPEEPGHAGNVNLAVFPEDVRASVAETVRAPGAGQFAGQRRGVVSDAAATAEAIRVAAGRSVEDWLKTRPGKAFSQPEVEALGETIVRVGRELDGLRAERASRLADGVEDRVLDARLAEKGLEHAALIGTFTGASAEAGRALRQFRRALAGTAGGSRVDAVRAAFRAIGTDQDAFGAWVRAYDQLAPDDLAGKYRLVQALTQPTKLEKLVAFTVSNMLSGTKSIAIQGVSGLNETVNRPLITLLDGDPRAAWDDVVAMANATGKAFGAGKEALLTGVRRSRLGDVAEPGRLDLVRPEAFPGKQGLVATPALRAISAQDETLRQLNAAGAAANYARYLSRSTGKPVAEILAEQPAGLRAYVDRESKRAVFEGDASPLAKKLIEIRSMLERGHGPAAKITGLVGHVLFPFVKIPDVVYRTGVGMLAEPVMPFARGVVRGYKGQPAVRRGELGRQRLATLLLTGYFGAAAAGNLTGDGPRDPAKRRVLMEARDENGDPIWQPHSFRVAVPGAGVRWFDYANLGPPSLPMGAIANAVEVYRERGQKVEPDYAAEIVNRTASGLLDASYIDTAGKVLKAIADGRVDELPTQLGQSALGRFVPYAGLVAQVARTAEGEVKQPRNPLEAVAARVPFVSELVPSRQSPLGGPAQAPEDVVSLASPVRPSARGEPNRAAAELARHDVGVAGPPPSVEGVPLQGAETRRYEEIAGPLVREEVQAVIDDPLFAGLSPREKQEELRLAVARGRKTAGETLLDEIGEAEAERRLERVGNLPVGGSPYVR